MISLILWVGVRFCTFWEAFILPKTLPKPENFGHCLVSTSLPLQALQKNTQHNYFVILRLRQNPVGIYETTEVMVQRPPTFLWFCRFHCPALPGACDVVRCRLCHGSLQHPAHPRWSHAVMCRCLSGEHGKSMEPLLGVEGKSSGQIGKWETQIGGSMSQNSWPIYSMKFVKVRFQIKSLRWSQ